MNLAACGETGGYVWAWKKPSFPCRKDGLSSRAIYDFRGAVQRAVLYRMSAFPGVSSYQSSSLGSKFVVIGVVCYQEMRGNALFHKVLRVLTKYLIK